MAYDVYLAAKLTGNTVSQLRHWRQSKLFVPELEDSSGHRFYSYRDLLALRTFARLRKETSLQKIRKAFQALRDLELTDHLSEYQLVHHDNSIRLIEQESDEAIVTDLATNERNTLLVTLEDVLGEFENYRGERVPAFNKPKEHLEVSPKRMGGVPTIAGTRVTYDTIAELFSDGTLPIERVTDFYPGVTVEAAREAVAFARELREGSPSAA